MPYNKVFLGMIIVSVATIFSACKKSDSVVSIAGSWNLYQTAEDDNANGIVDPSEIIPFETTTKTKITIFNNDGNGMAVTSYSAGVNDTTVFTWKLLNNNTQLQITPQGNLSSIENITLNNTDLIIENISTTIYAWEYFKRQ